MYTSYNLKISRAKYFVDFGVLTKVLALKILSCSIIQNVAFLQFTKILFMKQQDSLAYEILTFEKTWLYGTYVHIYTHTYEHIHIYVHVYTHVYVLHYWNFQGRKLVVSINLQKFTVYPQVSKCTIS